MEGGGPYCVFFPIDCIFIARVSKSVLYFQQMKAIINLFVRGVLFSCLGFFLPTLSWSSEALSVRLLSERHRTEWNWVEYRVSLVNESSVPILNPEIHYFAEN